MTSIALNPYQGADWNNQQKSQFHTHTTNAKDGYGGHNGTTDPDDTIDKYDTAGFDALSLNEHEFAIDSTTWPWTDLSSLGAYEDRDPDQLGMVAIEGCENDQGDGPDQNQHHVISLFSSVVTGSNAVEQTHNDGGVSIFSHPATRHDPSSWQWYQQYFDNYDSVLGVETLSASGTISEHKAMWDNLLTYYGFSRPIWSFAADDYHGTGGFHQHWNYVLTSEKTQSGIRTALENGRFYGVRADSEGGSTPTINSITVDEAAKEITINASGAASISWISEGSEIQTGAVLDYSGDSLDGSYARAELAGSSEAVTQPFYFAEPAAVIGDATLGDVSFGGGD